MRLGQLLALVFTIAWVPLFFIRAEKLGDAFPFYSRAERRAAIFAPTILTIHMALACFLMSLMPSVSTLRAVLGASIVACGIGFWVWARSAIGPLRVRRLPTEPPLRFRRDGPFAIVRNPLYFGMLVALTGPVVIAGRAVLIVTLGLCVIALAIRAKQEERWLHGHLGAEYGTYCREVKSLIPFVW